MLRASILAAGVWLGFPVASWVLATLTFRTADRVAGPEARVELAERLGPVPAEHRRMVLRHLAAEINRSMFRAWAAFQLVLGGVLVGLAWRLGAAARILAMADLVKAAALAGLQVLLLRRP